MQTAEEQYKVEVSKMQEALRRDHTRYDVLKNDANEKLVSANGKLEELKRSGEVKLIKLRAMVKKEESRVKALESDVEKKKKENEELTKICDQLIYQVGS